MSKAFQAIVDAARGRRCEVKQADDSFLEIVDVRRIRLRELEKGIEGFAFNNTTDCWETIPVFADVSVLADPEQSLAEAFEPRLRLKRRQRTGGTP